MNSYLESIVLVAGEYKDLVPWVGTIATLIATLVAAQGIGTWKKQLRGTTKHEAASQFLRALLKHRNALLKLSDPAWKEEEIAQAGEFYGGDLSNIDDSEEWLKEWKSNGRKFRYHHRQSIFNYRIENLNKGRAHLEDLELELEVLGINGIRDSLRKIDNLTYYLCFSIKTDLQYMFSETSSSQTETNKEFTNDMINSFTESGGKYYCIADQEKSRKEFEKDLLGPMEELEKIVRKFM